MDNKDISACMLTERIAYGHQVLTLENETIRLSVDVDQGAHLFELIDKASGIDVLYKDPLGLSDHNIGGWYELFPNAGKACQYDGSDIPSHGDVRYLPWTYAIEAHSSEEVRVALWTTSRVRPFTLRKTISIRQQVSAVCVTEQITNDSAGDEPYLWGHHVTFGAPFISADTRIDLPPCRIYGLPEYDAAASRVVQASSGTLTDMPGRRGGSVDFSYFPAEPASEMLFIDELQAHWYNVFNERSHVGFALAWDCSAFPALWLWQENRAALQPPFNGQVYGMALEPQSAPTPILANAVAKGQAPTLKAGQSKLSWLTAVLHHQPERVKRVSKQGELTV